MSGVNQMRLAAVAALIGVIGFSMDPLVTIYALSAAIAVGSLWALVVMAISLKRIADALSGGNAYGEQGFEMIAGEINRSTIGGGR